MNQDGLITLTGDISSMVTISFKKENGLNSKIVAEMIFHLKKNYLRIKLYKNSEIRHVYPNMVDICRKKYKLYQIWSYIIIILSFVK